MSDILFLGGCLANHTIPANALPFMLKVDEPLPLPGNPRLIVVRGSEPLRERTYVLRGNVATSTSILAATALKDFEAGQVVRRDEIAPLREDAAPSGPLGVRISGAQLSRLFDQAEVASLIRSDPRVKDSAK
jgi:hypothetical protein